MTCKGSSALRGREMPAFTRGSGFKPGWGRGALEPTPEAPELQLLLSGWRGKTDPSWEHAYWHGTSFIHPEKPQEQNIESVPQPSAGSLGPLTQSLKAS